MKQIILSALFLGTTLSMNAQSSYVSKVWNPDNGNGTYTNPVINADYSDPDAIEVDGEYWLTSSSFEHMPGLPILHSTDLVNWEIVNHAVQKPYGLEKNSSNQRLGHGNGIWAPSIRHHNGEFYIYWGDPDTGVWMVKTKNPREKWSKPLCVIEGKGLIDTTPLWDEDGRCYLVNGWANSRAGFNSVISVREMNAEGTAAISDPVIVFDGNGTEFRTAEGPKFYKYNGYYWIMFPAGGVPTGFQVAMRSKNIYGPYEVQKTLEQGSTSINGPHQGAWIHTSLGEDWFLHFQDKEAYGRVVHLQPVTWKDNWPVMGKMPKKGYTGEPVLTYQKPKSAKPSVNVNPVESDEFNTTKLGLQWQWQGLYQQNMGQATPWGYYRLYNFQMPANNPEANALGNQWDNPYLLLQKTPADEFTATTKLRLTAKENDEYGGLIMFGLDYSMITARRVGDEFVIERSTCQKADKKTIPTWTEFARVKPTEVDKVDYQPANHLDIWFRVKVENSIATFFYSTNGKNFKQAGEPFAMREGKWVGAKMGFVSARPTKKANNGWIDVDWFRVTK